MERSSAQDDRIIQFLELMVGRLELGWIQEALYIYDVEDYFRPSKCCLLGAAVLVNNDSDNEFDFECRIALNMIRSCVESLGFEFDNNSNKAYNNSNKAYLAQFNDTPGRTQQEVINVVKCAIENRKKEIGL